MPSIDTTAIENFDTMDADQLREFIKGFTYEDNAQALADAQTQAQKNKNAFDKAAHDLADYKKKLKTALGDLADVQANSATQIEETKTRADEQIAEMQKQIAEFQRDKTIAQHTARYVALGYDEALAAETATALSDGDLEKVFANQQAFMAEHDKAIKAASVQKPTKPGKGNEDPDNNQAAKTRDEIRAMPVAERIKYYTEHPEEYKKAYA
jgi:uncharacterized phage infection (PIP) family protein YhgE